jgi:hypothetical protein
MRGRCGAGNPACRIGNRADTDQSVFAATAARATSRLVPILAAALLSTGCGYIGGPLPPLANVPAPVRDMAAVQRGDKIIAQFTIPLNTTENLPIKDPLTLDLRIGTGISPFSADRWAAQAKQETPPPKAKGIARYEIASAAWTGKEVTIGVRVVGANGKTSDWSNFVVVQAVPPPEQPKEVRGESTPGGVRLTWSAKGEHFRVLRKGAPDQPNAQQYTVIGADLRQPEFTDTTAAIGTEYTYLAQTFVPLGENKEAQSDLSAEYKITRQAPPPATPSGLLAVPAPNSIELSWDSNAGAETTGYRIYRAVAGGGFTKIGEVSAVPTYSDRAVEHGKTYRYAVSAIDKDGSESARSALLEVLLP